MSPALSFALGLDTVTVVLIVINAWLMRDNWKLRAALLEAMAETMARLRSMQEINARNLDEIFRHMPPSDDQHVH